ncbi:MAG TPA: hypothetical protein VM008_07715 [Phycisphaerae bacterium]|nr:hypothetical protein [Phycisphaerae bacterium]
MGADEHLFNRATDKMVRVLGEAVLVFIVVMIRPLATLTEILLRKYMGERYFNGWNLVGGLVLLSAATAVIAGVPEPHAAYQDFYGVHPAVSGVPLSLHLGTSVVWSVLLLLFSILHSSDVKNRYERGVRWHSRCIGIPRFQWLRPEVGQVLLFVYALFLAYWHVYAFSFLIIYSLGISLIMRWNEARTFWNRMLDIIDGQIEQENLAAAVRDRVAPDRVEGLRAPLPVYVSTEFREKFIQAAQASGAAPPVLANAGTVPGSPAVTPVSPPQVTKPWWQ